jgi:CheY-like chemotaxis protein
LNDDEPLSEQSFVLSSQALGFQKDGNLRNDNAIPDGNGFDLMRELRSRGHALPAIAVSGYGRDEDLAHSRAAGFSAHLIKPIDPDRLLTAISVVSKGGA